MAIIPQRPKGPSLAAKLSTALAALIGILALLTVYLGIYTVDEGHRAIVKRWGEAIEVTSPAPK